MKKQARPILNILVLLFLLTPLAGCEIAVRPLEPTQGPPPPAGSACAAISTGELELWLANKLPRFEQEVVGGAVYLGPPQVTNCLENTAYFQVRVGYQRPGLQVELSVLEDSFDLAYYPDESKVCLDLHAMIPSGEISSQGVEQVGQEIKVAEVQAEMAKASPDMPTETRQRLDRALGQAGIQGGDPQTQGIGPEAAGLLLQWALDELLQRFNSQLADLIGACILAE